MTEPRTSKQRAALEELVLTATEVHRISHRTHEAWIALAAALNKARAVMTQPDETADSRIAEALRIKQEFDNSGRYGIADTDIALGRICAALQGELKATASPGSCRVCLGEHPPPECVPVKATQSQALDEMVRLSQEMGGYDLPAAKTDDALPLASQELAYDDPQARINLLENALRVYGGHTAGCPGSPCGCGFQQVWELLFER